MEENKYHRLTQLVLFLLKCIDKVSIIWIYHHNSNAPHADVLENFNPNLGADPFRWIPQDLMWDLMDNGENFTISGVNDQVSGYTIKQIFTALQNDVTSVPQYKVKLLLQNPSNSTNPFINNLFTSYGY